VTVASSLLDPGEAPITPARDDGELPVLIECSTDLEEAQRVAHWLLEHRQPGSPWRQMAVLARTNAQLEVVAQALESLDIPFERRGPDHSPASDITIHDPTARTVTSDSANAVALSTIHRAKGLEWHHVAVIGCSEGQLPTTEPPALPNSMKSVAFCTWPSRVPNALC
jgi:DNA helicase-2/ATP-dependent DNA helicase PcrA